MKWRTKKGGTLEHSMISNGSLLLKDQLDWAIKTGLTSVQVTIDRPADVHDQRRPGADGSKTLATIMDNVERAAPSISITIRVNVDRTNLDRMVEVLDELVARGLHRFVGVDLGHIRAFTAESEGEFTDAALSKKEYAVARIRLVEELLRREFTRALPALPTRQIGAICVADSPAGYVVSPRGLVFGCWNEVANEPKYASYLLGEQNGAVTLDPENEGVKTAWELYDPFEHSECSTCLVAPLCRGGWPTSVALLKLISTPAEERKHTPLSGRREHVPRRRRARVGNV